MGPFRFIPLFLFGILLSSCGTPLLRTPSEEARLVVAFSLEKVGIPGGERSAGRYLAPFPGKIVLTYRSGKESYSAEGTIREDPENPARLIGRGVLEGLPPGTSGRVRAVTFDERSRRLSEGEAAVVLTEGANRVDLTLRISGESPLRRDWTPDTPSLILPGEDAVFLRAEKEFLTGEGGAHLLILFNPEGEILPEGFAFDLVSESGEALPYRQEASELFPTFLTESPPEEALYLVLTNPGKGPLSLGVYFQRVTLPPETDRPPDFDQTRELNPVPRIGNDHTPIREEGQSSRIGQERQAGLRG